jgi:hypothetical protein
MEVMLMIITGENKGKLQDNESPVGRLFSVKYDDFYVYNSD